MKREKKIPNIIHQIWLEDIPLDIESATKSVKNMNNTAKYMLWTEENLEYLGLKTLYGKIPLLQLVNIMKLRVLTKFGGWFVDPNLLPLLPITSIPELYHYQDIVCSSSPYEIPGQNTPTNTLIGCEQGYDFENLINNYMVSNSVQLKAHWDRFCKENKIALLPPDIVDTQGKIFKELPIGETAKKSDSYYKQTTPNIPSKKLQERLIDDLVTHKQSKSPYLKETYHL